MPINTWMARAKCVLPRPDLRERGYGDGAIGFRAELPAWLRDGRSHAVEVRLSTPGFRLVGNQGPSRSRTSPGRRNPRPRPQIHLSPPRQNADRPPGLRAKM